MAISKIDMKIYYLVNARIPTEKAHGIQLAKMCEAFIRAGNEVELIVPNRINDSTSLRDFYKLKTEVVLKRLPILNIYNQWRWGFIFGSISFMFSYLFYFWFKRIFKREKFIIYTSDIDQFSFLFVRLIGVPYFAEFHDYKPKTIPYSFFLGGISGIITINKIIKEKLKEVYKLSENKFIVEPNGIDLEMFDVNMTRDEARRKLGLPLEKKIAIYVGQFYDWKGLDILAKAGELLVGKCDIYLVGGNKNQLMTVTGRNNFPENVICAGLRPYEEMPLWLAAADALLVLGTKKNDYSYYSTSPMKLSEYMASKRPILAAKTPAITDVISDREVVFYEPDNAGTLAEKIGYIMNNPDEAGARVGVAYEAVKRYEWRVRTGRIMSFIYGNQKK